MFQSPIGWGLSCEDQWGAWPTWVANLDVSIPYWLGSKLRGPKFDSNFIAPLKGPLQRFNPLLVGV
jgi:hypothetical protein